MAENRRVRMSKQMMKNALLELLENAPIDKISVTDICKTADVNRSTFYAYYQEPADVLRDIEEDALEQIPALQETKEYYTANELLDIFEEYFQYLKEHQPLFRLLIARSGSDDFNRRLVTAILKKYKKPCMAENPLLVRYGSVFSISGVVGILKSWIEEDFPVSPRKFSEIALKMSLQATDIQSIKLD